jgi:tRNA threonylcarbamoyladenosine biosynthesis protein TsaB
MYILHIETSTKVCSIAISKEDQVLEWEDKGDAMNHAAILAPMIEEMLRRCGLSARDLGGVSVSSGPGSYTGLRVGGSTAKSFAYSLNIPLIAVPTLEALSITAIEKHATASHILPMIDARRDEVYTSLFDRYLSILWPDLAARVSSQFIEENLSGQRKVVCCGDGAFKVKPFLADFPNLMIDEEIVCSARNLVKPAWSRMKKKDTDNPLHFTPRYLKPPNITQPRRTA